MPSAAGAIVMGTGIVSLALSLDREPTLAHILLALAALAWMVLGGLAALRLARDPTSWARRTHSPAALTAVAGTTVLAAGVTTIIGWRRSGSPCWWPRCSCGSP